MKLMISLCLLAVVAAAPPTTYEYSPKNVVILDYLNNNAGFGNYQYRYSQSDGSYAEQEGELQNADREDASLAVRGVFQWVSPNGVTYKVTYTADKNGYQPQVEEGPGAPPPGHLTATIIG